MKRKQWGQRKKRKRFTDPAKGTAVTVFNNNVEEALRRFKKKVEEAGILEAIHKNQFYEKPSVINRRKKKERIAQSKRAARLNRHRSVWPK